MVEKTYPLICTIFKPFWGLFNIYIGFKRCFHILKWSLKHVSQLTLSLIWEVTHWQTESASSYLSILSTLRGQNLSNKFSIIANVIKLKIKISINKIVNIFNITLVKIQHIQNQHCQYRQHYPCKTINRVKISIVKIVNIVYITQGVGLGVVGGIGATKSAILPMSSRSASTKLSILSRLNWQKDSAVKFSIVNIVNITQKLFSPTLPTLSIP